MESHIENDKTLIYCGEVLELQSIDDIKTVLIQSFVTNSIEIHANDIKKIDTAALQVLLSFILTAVSKNKQVHWINPSRQLILAASMIGIAKLLKLPQ